MVGLIRKFGFAAVVTAGIALMALLAVMKAVWPSDAATAPGGGPGGPPQAVGVSVATAALHTFADDIQAIGTAQARESIVITPKVADTIRAIRFESGDRVRQGQVLVEMSSVEQRAGLAEERAAAEAAQEELRRAQELFDRGFASQARIDAAKAAADAAQARVAANASRTADRTLRAPFAGVVGLRTASPGQYMQPGDRIGTLDDLSEIKLDFDVPETQLALLRPGVAIAAHTAAYPERKFDGVISQVDSRISSDTRTVRVRAVLPNPDETIHPGMLMTVAVRANPREALATPEIALLDEAGASFVFRVAGQGAALTVERVQVQTGLRAGGMAEIVSGLQPGDRVVVEGLQSVRPGQAVKLLPSSADGEAERTTPRG
jgi:membrane fusion protein, multidrug efflux system